MPVHMTKIEPSKIKQLCMFKLRQAISSVKMYVFNGGVSISRRINHIITSSLNLCLCVVQLFSHTTKLYWNIVNYTVSKITVIIFYLYI